MQNNLFLSPSLLPLKVFCFVHQIARHFDIVDLSNGIHNDLFFADGEHKTRNFHRVHHAIEAAELRILQIWCLQACNDQLITISCAVKLALNGVSLHDHLVFFRGDHFYHERNLISLFILEIFKKDLLC